MFIPRWKYVRHINHYAVGLVANGFDDRRVQQVLSDDGARRESQSLQALRSCRSGLAPASVATRTLAQQLFPQKNTFGLCAHATASALTWIADLFFRPSADPVFMKIGTSFYRLLKKSRLFR